MYFNSELVEKAGRIGAFAVKVRTGTGDLISLQVGAIVVATGFEPYTPKNGEFGFGLEGVVTLPEFKELLATRPNRLVYRGREIRTIAYIYCVGSREASKEGAGHSDLLAVLLQCYLPHCDGREPVGPDHPPVPSLPGRADLREVRGAVRARAALGLPLPPVR